MHQHGCRVDAAERDVVMRTERYCGRKRRGHESSSPWRLDNRSGNRTHRRRVGLVAEKRYASRRGAVNDEKCKDVLRTKEQYEPASYCYERRVRVTKRRTTDSVSPARALTASMAGDAPIGAGSMP